MGNYVVYGYWQGIFELAVMSTRVRIANFFSGKYCTL